MREETVSQSCLQILPSYILADCLPVQQRVGAASHLLGVPLGLERSHISWWDLMLEESQMFLVLLSAGSSKVEEADEERQSSRRAKDSLRIDTDVTLLLGKAPILKFLKREEKKKKSPFPTTSGTIFNIPDPTTSHNNTITHSLTHSLIHFRDSVS